HQCMLERDEAAAWKLRWAVWHRDAVAIRDEVFVVNREKMRGAMLRRTIRRVADRPVGEPVYLLRYARVHLETAFGIRDREAGPPREIPHRGGPVAHEIPAAQAGERFVAR